MAMGARGESSETLQPAAFERVRRSTRALQRELSAVQELLADGRDLQSAGGPDEQAFIAGVLSHYAELTQADAELSAVERRGAVALHRTLVQPIFLGVPLIRRSIDRPFGYPGDYRMVEMIFGDGPHADLPLSALLERVVLQSAPSRAHRYRVPWAERWLERRAREQSEPLRVLSFACGPERMLRAYAEHGASMHVMLCDHDVRALAHARTELARHSRERGSIHAVELSAVQLIRGAAGAALRQGVFADGFDLVLVLGLFDYLRDGLVRHMMRAFATLLRPNGLVLASNLSAANPHRSLMEYVGDWYVLHREPHAFAQLLAGDGSFTIAEATSDPTGANLLLAVQRSP